MSGRYIFVEGTFKSREEAAAALENIASRIRLGEYSATCSTDANPQVFVTLEPDQAELPDHEDVLGLFNA